ncbi:MAG TPA: hypothetical protein VF177_06305 [Anaerolineae bacterium]
MSTQLLIEVLLFGFSLWLGLYLIGRDPADARLRWAGLGLVAYAMALALDTLILYAPAATARQMARWQQPFLFLPALSWLLVLVMIWRGDVPWRTRLKNHPQPVGLILAATLFFSLGLGLLLFPLGWLPRLWILAGIGVDLLLLGVAIAMLDAFDQGEHLLPHLLRSLDYTFFTALLFGGQVTVVMALSTGVTFPMLVLLLTTIAAAVLVQTLAGPLQLALDQIAFFNFPETRQAQAQLRAAADAVRRVDHTLNPNDLPEEEFVRLTRRALSHMGDLPRLVASPLTRLQLVETHLARRESPANTLERAAELKAVLRESIERLKPRNKGDFGTTDEWRYYNALYFPYVVGLKPYSRYATSNHEVDDTAQLALDWFRSQVPQRTLHNWQNAAAQLIAQDLRERSRNI